MQRQLDQIKKVVPQIEVIHELGATEPEECLLAMGMDVPLLPCTFHLYSRTPEIVESWSQSGLVKTMYWWRAGGHWSLGCADTKGFVRRA